MNTEQLQIGVPTENDKTQWQGLYRGYADFYNMPMTDQVLDTLWRWIHDEHNPFYCIVARDAESVLQGFMHFRAMPSPLRGAMVGFLDDLFVSSESRGQGIVNALYKELENQGRDKGWPLIRWITADNNYRARNVYDQLSSKTHWVTYQMDL